MNGNKSIRLTDRDLHLFRELRDAKIFDCAMIREVCGLPSVNRANDRLLQLHRAGFLRRYFVGTKAGGRKSLYTLSPKSAVKISAESFWKLQRPENSLVVSHAFIEHQCAVNWMWIATKYRKSNDFHFCRWLTFPQPLSEHIPLIPDGYAELSVSGTLQPIFFEVDLGTEASRVWERKVALYIKLATSGEFARIFHQPRFKIAVVTTSALRQRNLQRIVTKQTTKIFYFNLLEIIQRDGLLASSWLRPDGEVRQLLA